MKRVATLLLFIFAPIFIRAEITHPYTLDEKPQVLFGDSIEIQVPNEDNTATTTYKGLENYVQDYVNGYAHFSFSYTHISYGIDCCYAAYPPLVYVTDVDPRATTTPTERTFASAYTLTPKWGDRGEPTGVYFYDIQFDATGYTAKVVLSTSTEIYNTHIDVSNQTNSDWVALANRYLLNDPPSLHSMAFAPVPIFEFAQQILDPVIIVPGIMGSALKSREWIIDPIFHIYDNLVETLEKNGYVKEENLFTFGYDWRESNIETAEKLKEKIDEIKESAETEKVDIIAHSMGGLVARAYAQSSDYENDIDQLIFLGTPHRGAPEDYLTWEAGELARGLRGRFIRYHYSNEAKRLGFNNLFDYIRNWPIKSVKELLPIYDYLRDADSGEIMNYPDRYPENDFLENLNSGLVAFLESDTGVTNIIGDDGGNTISIIRITNEDRLPLWEDGYPEGYNEIFGDKGLEVGKGDGTVPEYSSSIAEALDIEIESSHVWLPSEAEEEIYKELSGKEIGETVKKSISSRISIFEIFSPADIAIIDPQGRMVGKDFETNEEINEIPGAFYSGFDTDNEFITIPDPVDGEYKIKLQGTGNGTYGVTASNVSEENISESNFAGFISENIEVGLDVNIENEDIDQIVPEDQMPPIITIKSPEEKDYLRSEKINISAEFSDDSGVASSSLMINKNFFENGDEYDPFFFNLGTTTLFATSTDYLNNTATTSLSFRIIANASSTISDINRLYGLGWIKKKEVKNSLIKQIELMTKFLKRVEFVEKKLPNGKIFTRRIERIERITDKLLAKIFLIQLDILLKQKIINQETHDILSEDIMWIINH